MTIFDFLTMLGSLSLFLFGMSVMGTALEKRAGGSLKAILAKLTSGRFSGLLTGLAVTAVIQSSSATTVMVVGFVNSGLLSLRQSIPVIMGANIGTTITGKGWNIAFDQQAGRTRVLFQAQPTDAQKAAIENAGFYWSAQLNSWNKKLTCKAYRAAQALAVALNALA